MAIINIKSAFVGILCTPLYVVEGGQVIPAAIAVENYDVAQVKYLWNGSEKKKVVKMAASGDAIKKKFLRYLSALRDYNQKNYGGSLVTICYIREQMRRKELKAKKAIKMGVINVIGPFGSGKSVSALFWRK